MIGTIQERMRIRKQTNVTLIRAVTGSELLLAKNFRGGRTVGAVCLVLATSLEPTVVALVSVAAADPVEMVA